MHIHPHLPLSFASISRCNHPPSSSPPIAQCALTHVAVAENDADADALPVDVSVSVAEDVPDAEEDAEADAEEVAE